MNFPDYLDILKDESKVNLVRLVRDRALDDWRTDGKEFQVRPVLGKYEHEILLKKKLIEEVFEVIHADFLGLPGEIADAVAVLKGIANFNNIDWELVIQNVAEKEFKTGPFNEGMVWDRTIEK